jgi:hypothetical protein
MTRNRTGIDLLITLGPEVVFVVILALAIFLAVSRYLWFAGEQRRRVEFKVHRRALRRLAA